ncbi:hybrid sensor histidine kinase/response regulator [Ramlibacter rhizophilus]|uniref:histidine kinase n=1 Tax=Ramlibacter rhizophilus TaxID=1781167 RepID=A0A4Z0BZH5_9BURK|nr:ATP-binding protein [Ramlibacter rhizophilus]TFZ04747.1 PAS domain S-box protein [Ramlibacter rhizophilus]
MKFPPLPANEDERLCRLTTLGVLDTGAEPVLDSFTDLASSVCGMPVALISLVDEERQWMKAAVGLPQGFQTSRTISFCGHAITSGEALFEIADAQADERFHDNPLVTGPLKVRHYAGAPLEMPTGERIGTLCVIGPQPGRLDETQRTLLVKLAASVVQVLMLREARQDLDARLRTERELRESEASFRALTNTIPQMVWSTAPDGQVSFVNERWFDFTGLTPQDAEATDWSRQVHPDDMPLAVRDWRACLASGEIFEAEYRLRHHTGTWRWVLARALPVHGEGGRLLRWLGTLTDIDDQKRAREELELANRRKDEFLAMLAHELRNPLAPLSTAAQVLRMAPGDAGRVLKAGELIARQVTHMTALVDDLLDVSRVTRGLVDIKRELLDLQQVVQESLEQTRPQLEARGHQLELSLPPAPVFVLGDPVRMLQVVSNLLNNAAKYTPEGGRIGLALAARGDKALLTVHDNGSGIDPQLLPQLFDLFTQAKRTPDRSQGGLGLGLALARSLARLHGGDITVHSEGPGSGSTFTVSLPLAQAPVMPVPSPAPEPLASSGRSLDIMVVDDNADAAEMLATWLSMQGHRAHVETGSTGALEAAQRSPAEVYILDIGLPEMDGYELARRLRASPRTRRATLVALTGYGQPLDMRQSREAGFDYHFVKPMSTARMATLLAQIAPSAAGSRAKA